MNQNAHKEDFADLCKMLPSLSGQEREQVRLRLGQLSPQPTLGGEPDWLLRGIEDELRRRGLLGSGHLPAVRIYAKWPTLSEDVRADLQERLGIGGRKRRAPWAALGRLAARSLADYLTGGGIRVSPRTMLQNADKVFVAIDDQFPGYMEAGVLRCCLDPKLVGA